MNRRIETPAVVESICEIEFAGSAWDATLPGLLYARLRDRFSLSADSTEAELAAGSIVREGTLAGPSTGTRSRFSRADGAGCVQVAKDLLVVNQVGPDPSSASLGRTVSEVVALYLELARPRRIAGVVLRELAAFVAPENAAGRDFGFRIRLESPASGGVAGGRYVVHLEMPSASEGHAIVATFGYVPARHLSPAAWALHVEDRATLSAATEATSRFASALREAEDNVARALAGGLTAEAQALVRGPRSSEAGAVGVGTESGIPGSLRDVLRLLALDFPEAGEKSIWLSLARRSGDSLSDLRGLGKEVWKNAGDAQDHVDRLRDEWT